MRNWKLVVGLGMLVGSLIIFAKPVFAGTYTSGNLKIVTEKDPLFSTIEGLWWPGRQVSRWVEVTNLDSADHDAGIIAENHTDNGLASAMKVIVTLGGVEKYNDTLENFYNAGEINIGYLSAGSTSHYDFKLVMNDLSGNIFQDKSTGFDLRVGLFPYVTTSTTSPEGQGTTEGGATTVPAGHLAAGITFQATGTESTLTSVASSTVPGEVKGTEESQDGTETNAYLWWSLIFLPIIFGLVLYFLLRKKRNPN